MPTEITGDEAVQTALGAAALELAGQHHDADKVIAMVFGDNDYHFNVCAVQLSAHLCGDNADTVAVVDDIWDSLRAVRVSSRTTATLCEALSEALDGRTVSTIDELPGVATRDALKLTALVIVDAAGREGVDPAQWARSQALLYANNTDR